MRDRIIRRLERVRLTRESLVRMSLGILGGFILLSILLSFIGDSQRSVLDRAMELSLVKGRYPAEEHLVTSLRRNPDQRSAWIFLCRLRSSAFQESATDVQEIVEDFEKEFEGEGLLAPKLRLEERNDAPYLTESEFEAFLETSPVPREILNAWRLEGNLERALEELAPIESLLEAQLAGASLCRAAGASSRALDYFDRALALDPDNRTALRGRFEVQVALGRTEQVEAALADPKVRAALDARFLFDYYRGKGELGRSILPLLRSEYERWTLGVWLTVIAIGLCWMVFSFHLGTGATWRRPLQWLIPVALVLGWLSADATLASVLYFDHWLGEDNGSRGVNWHLLHALLIGVREEFWKLLLFVPLLPYLLRAASEVQAITLASIVGLGFAVNENTNYIMGSGGSGIIDRFLTANFLHMALTGYAGYFLFRALRQKTRNDWIQAGEALAKVMVVHGAYDFFIIAPQLRDWGFLSLIIFILISQQYLRLIFHIRPHRAQRVSTTRIFVATLATVTGMHYLYLSTHAGIGAAIWQTIGGLLGIAIIVVMYFQEFDERVA